MPITRNFTLYLNAGISVAPTVHVNQSDRGEQWIFTLLDDKGQKYTPSDGALIGVKADGHAIVGVTGTVGSDGNVYITETQQMTAAAGKAIFELTIDGMTHGTANFIVQVEKKPTEDAVLSESDLSIIQQGIDSVTPAAINETVSEYLAEHMTNPPIDPTLTVSNAAADAKVTGDKVTDLKSAISDLQETVFKEITYTFKNDASVTSGSSIKESEVNVACNIPSGTNYSVEIITSGTLFNKTAIIARRSGNVEDGAKYNCVANIKYTLTAAENVVSVGLYSGSGDVVGSGTLTIQVQYVVTNADSLEEQVETLTSEVSSIDSFIGTIPMKSHVYDLSSVTEYKGKTQTAIGSTISMEQSSTWYYKKVDCEGFALVTITELVSANPAPYHTYVFTDSSDKVLAVDDGSHGSAIEYKTYTDVAVPANAKYLYMFSYSQSNTISLSYKTVHKVGDELVSISEEALAKDKARFDDRFLYVAYSTVSGSGCSINTKEHFIWCAEHGFNSIKGDVRPTSDGKLVMCHDAGFTLDNSGDIVAYNAQDNTPIHSLTYAQCIALKHANTGQYVCGIDDFLYVCKKYGLVAYITVRDEYVSEIVNATFEALDAFRMRDYCIINSFTLQTLIAFREQDEHITLSNVLQTSNVLSTSDIDNAVTLGNCQICAFDYPTFGGISRIPSSVLEYAVEKDIRIYEAQINSLTDLDDIIYKGISGAHMTIPISAN